MRQIGLYLLAFVVAIFLLAYTTTYTVRFTEAAVKTRFGSAGEGSVQQSPGLKFKLPLVDSVTSYDTRPRVTQARLETAGTKDGRQLIVETFCIWRVSDPLKFFQKFSSAMGSVDEHYRLADETVRSNLRNALGAVSKFELKQLFSSDPATDGLADLEREVLKNLSATSAPTPTPANAAASDMTLSGLGIEVVDVGISRIVLPAETTSKVFDRMSETQNTKAKKITSGAEATAQSIRTRATEDAKRIESFANVFAAEIRAKGDKEAERYYELQRSNPELAQFLIEVQTLKEMYGRKGTVLVLPMNMPVLRTLNPDHIEKIVEKFKGAQTPANGGAK